MVCRKALVFSLLSLIFFIPLYSKESASEGLTLDQCLSIALAQNPLILSSHQQYQASLARVNQAKALSQPSLDIDTDLQPGFFDLANIGESYFGLRQTLEFPGKRSLRGKIASQESNEIMQEIKLLKLDIAFQIKQAFFSLLLAKELQSYAEQNLGLSRDFLEKAEVKHETGDVAKVEVLRAQVEASKAANEVRQANNSVKLAKALLNFLLARKKHEPLEIQGELKQPPLDLDLESLIKKAMLSRPELKKILFSLKREDYRKKEGILSYLPDFELGASKHWIEGEGSFWDVTLSLPIPLFFWQPIRGEVAEARANHAALKSEEKHIQNAVVLEVEEAYRNALTARNQIILFEQEILTQAEEVYNMFLFSYQEGEIGGIELIEARRTLIDARKSYADALFNYDVSLAALEKSVGQTLIGESK